MSPSWEEHQKLIDELDQKKIEHEARKVKEQQEAEEAPLREQALELARLPVDLTRYRNERNLMLFPFCSTAKAKRVKSIRYNSADKKRWLEVTANHEYGMVKIWDFDILRFAITKAGEIALKVGYFPPYIDFTAYECLKAIGRITNTGKSYSWLEEALDRLTTTAYKGNIFKEDEKRSETFTLISIESVKDENKRIEKIRIHFNQRIRESAKLRGLLVIDSAIFHEESGIKKRLLELVMVSIGKEQEWTVGLERLQALCAHEGELKEFKRQLKSYEFPWVMSFNKSKVSGENVTFRNGNTVIVSETQ
ncbi:MAG: replication initiator protein A [Candidatus Competibacteraceae bacterium]|nr:replication initiator protein A [Candidatus Competibacteraceae bacterium]